MFFDFEAGRHNSPPLFHSFKFRDINPLSGHGKTRRLYAPNEVMRGIHRQLIRYVRKLSVQRSNSTGARPGSSPLKNVLRHKQSDGSFPQFFFLVDISHAYANVDLEKMVELFVRLDPDVKGHEVKVRQFMEAYCFLTGENGTGLVVGAPASPDLFNLYCEVLLDPKIRQLCEQYGLTYTRYLDDLTFSSSSPIGEKKRRALRTCVESEGFTTNARKARVFDLTKGPIVVNGVGIRMDGTYFMPRHALRELRGLLHLALSGADIDPHLIHGKMGLFRSLTSTIRANQTEMKVFLMYRDLKKRYNTERDRKRRKKQEKNRFPKTYE